MAGKHKKIPLYKRKEFQFLAFFLGIYGVFQAAYFLIPWSILENTIYYHGIVSISADIINAFTNEQVTAAQNKLSSSKAILVIVRGCDGAGTMFLLAAAIIAFSATLKHKIIGLVLGIALLYVINQIRIIGLYFVVAYQRDLFLPIHTYFAPTLVIIISGLFFIWWTMSATKNAQLNSKSLSS